MNNTALLERREKLLGPAYRLFYDEPVHVVRGEGVWLYDADASGPALGGLADACLGAACASVLNNRLAKTITLD